MVLIYKEIESKIYPPIINNGVLDEPTMKKMGFPQYAIDSYKIMVDRNRKEFLEEPQFWEKEPINNTINNFLKEKNITKKKLHSIKKLARRFLDDNDRAEIIYEE